MTERSLLNEICLFAFEALSLDIVTAAVALKVPSQANVRPASPFPDLGVEVNEAQGSLRPK